MHSFPCCEIKGLQSLPNRDILEVRRVHHSHIYRSDPAHAQPLAAQRLRCARQAARVADGHHLRRSQLLSRLTRLRHLALPPRTHQSTLRDQPRHRRLQRPQPGPRAHHRSPYAAHRGSPHGAASYRPRPRPHPWLPPGLRRIHLPHARDQSHHGHAHPAHRSQLRSHPPNGQPAKPPDPPRSRPSSTRS